MNAPQKIENPSAAIASGCMSDGNATKALANVKAAFALAGHSVYELAEGGFIVVRPAWNGVRHCRDLNGLYAFARMVGVPT